MTDAGPPDGPGVPTRRRRAISAVVAVVAGCCLLTTGPVAAQRDSLTIQFIGNAAFALSDGHTTLLTDYPYRPGAFGYMTYDSSAVRPPGTLVSVITHRHADHFDAGRFTAGTARLVGPAEVAATLSADRVLSFARPASVGAFSVMPHRTPHGDTEHYSHVIAWRGRRMYFTGDTEDPTHLLATRDLDIAFVTPWLLCTIVRRGAEITAEVVVLHHQSPDGSSQVCGSPRIMTQGERFAVASQDRPPER